MRFWKPTCPGIFPGLWYMWGILAPPFLQFVKQPSPGGGNDGISRVGPAQLSAMSVVGVEERQGAIAEVMPWPLKNPILKAHKIGLVLHMCRSDSADNLHLPIFVHTSLIPPRFPV